MVINIEQWLNKAIKKLQNSYSDRLLFVGIQGSYCRGEATEDSDIDLVVVLDVLHFDDLKVYKNIIDEMPYKEKACGFISGKNELKKWSKSDLFQFFYETKSLLGEIKDIIEPPAIEDIKITLKTGFENIYHQAVYSFVHSNNQAADLQKLYKMTFFIIQAKYFIETKRYVQSSYKLLETLDGFDKEILNICINRKEILSADNKQIESFYKKLIEWSLCRFSSLA